LISSTDKTLETGPTGKGKISLFEIRSEVAADESFLFFPVFSSWFIFSSFSHLH
jgi:hypothetical protein